MGKEVAWPTRLFVAVVALFYWVVLLFYIVSPTFLLRSCAHACCRWHLPDSSKKRRDGRLCPPGLQSDCTENWVSGVWGIYRSWLGGMAWPAR
jgi:hypothetical protein